MTLGDQLVRELGERAAQRLLSRLQDHHGDDFVVKVVRGRTGRYVVRVMISGPEDVVEGPRRAA